MTELSGVFPDLPTPFLDDESLDLPSIDHIVDFVLSTGAHGVTVGGIEGEARKLSLDERRLLAERVVARAGRRVPVLIGVSHNATYHARELIAHGHRLEVAGFIAAPPVEERRSEERIRRFYATLADAAEGLPVFVQDRPQATGVSFSTELLLRVSEDAANLGFVIVESPPTGRRISRLVRESGGKVRVFGGMNGQFMREELVRGASGCVPGAVFTDALVAIWNMVQQGDHKGAARFDRAFLPLLHHCSQSVDWEVNCTKTLFKKGGLMRTARLRQPAQAFDDVAVEQLMVYAADLDLAILRA